MLYFIFSTVDYTIRISVPMSNFLLYKDYLELVNETYFKLSYTHISRGQDISAVVIQF